MVFNDDSGGEVFTLEFSPDRSQETPVYEMEDKTHTVEIQTYPQIDQATLESAENVGSILSGANTITGGATDYISIILAFLSFDPSGSLMKFSQMNKLLSRFRFLNINFGVLLTSYFEVSASKFDPPSKNSPDWVRDHSDGYRAKFNIGSVALDIFEYKIVNVILFLVSWTLKSIGYMILREASNTMKISAIKCKFVYFS